MRELNVHHFKRAFPRMSWHPRNLFNLWRRSYGPLEKITNRVEYRETLNWRRWTAKALMRGYHGDFINEKIFKRWYLPETLPDVRPPSSATASSAVADAMWATKDTVAQRWQKQLEDERRKGLAPVGSLMMAEIERRIDVVIFRACFAHSVYEARRMVIHGSVLLNGKKHTNTNTRLAPGDMVSVDPTAIVFLRPKRATKEPAEEVDPEAAAAEADEPVSEAEEAADVEGAEAAAEAPPTPTESAAVKLGRDAILNAKRDLSTPVKGDDLTPFHLPAYAAPWLFVPAYLEPSFSTCSVIYLRHPTARPGYSEIPTPWDADGEVVRLAWEWYSKRRMRIRSKSQLARMPENRQHPTA